MSGRISILVSPELQLLARAVREMPSEVNKEIRKHTRTNAEPIWKEAVLGRVQNRLQTRVLADSARVAVSDQNVTLKAGGVGKLSSGTPRSALALGVEFGNDPNRIVQATSAKGRQYQRRLGKRFGLPRARGYVVYPAAGENVPRLAALWIQTAQRTIHEVFEDGGARG